MRTLSKLLAATALVGIATTAAAEDTKIGILMDITGPIASLQSFSMVRQSNGLLYSHSMAAGAPIDLDPVLRSETGPDWYVKD